MLPDVTEVKYLGDFRLFLRFSDGLEGEVDLAEELYGEVFEPLKNQDYFRQVRVDPEIGTICWPNGADFAPEFLHDCVAAAPRRA